MSYRSNYTMQLQQDAVPLDGLLPPYESLFIKIRVFRYEYANNTVQVFPEHARTFPLLREALLYEDMAQYFLSDYLSKMGIPDHKHGHLIHGITAFCMGLGLNPSSSTCRGGAIPKVIANIWVENWILLNESEEEVSRPMDESMEFDTFRPMPASKSAIEALEKVRVDGLCSMEKCMICLETLCVGKEATWMPCSHLYHGDFTEKWLETSHLCPLCRFEMQTDLVAQS